jgi:hypothetical protein
VCSSDLQTWFGSNVYYNAGYKYITSNPATRYAQNNATHLWDNAPSGTAGDAISFTQAMTLTAGGNFLVGTTDASMFDTNAGADVGGFYRLIATGGGGAVAYGFTASNGGADGKMSIWGTNSASKRLPICSVGSSYSSNTAGSESSFMSLFTMGSGVLSERARIDSSGNVLVGSTSESGGGERLFVSASLNGTAQRIYNFSGSTPQGLYIFYPSVAPNSTASEFLICGDTSATRMVVRSNGGIANFSANDANLSDRREKTNFAPAKSYLDVICAIPIQTFNYIDQNHEEDPGLTLGVVAQDVQEVAPELVMESNWGNKEEPKMRLSIYQTDLQYALMKSIQELKAELDTVKAELATLKGN